MNRERAKQLLPIIQAFADGKTIEYKAAGTWHALNDDPLFSFAEYRIKPEPREYWAGTLLCVDAFPTPPFIGAMKVRKVVE